MNTVLFSFLPPLVDALSSATAERLPTLSTAEDLPGRPGGTSLIQYRSTPESLVPAEAAQPDMVRGPAASAVLAIVRPEGA